MKKIILFLILALFIATPLFAFQFGDITTVLSDNWKTALGTLLVIVGGFYIPGLRTLLILGAQTVFSEAVLKKIFLSIAETFVKSTKTKIDDVWLAELKKKL